jgi:hypothetical protein
MPKKSRHWVRLVWKKCPVSNQLILILGSKNTLNKGISENYFPVTILKYLIKDYSICLAWKYHW